MDFEESDGLMPDPEYWEKEIKCADKYCDVLFIPNYARQKYCCHRCNKRNKNRRKKERRRAAGKASQKESLDKECVGCGNKFTTTFKAKKYCNLYCAKSYYKAKYRKQKPKKKKKEAKTRQNIRQAKYYFNAELTKEEINLAANSIPYNPLKYCIYFLWRDSVVVYVGKSDDNLESRINSHNKKKRDGVWDFTHVTYHIHGKKQGLYRKENRYIYYYKSLGQCEYNNPLQGRVEIKERNIVIDDDFFISPK